MATLTPTLWGVTQEQFDANDMILSSMLYYIAEDDLQHVGTPLESGVYFCQTDEPRESNPLTLTFWNFATRMTQWIPVDPDEEPTDFYISNLFSEVYNKTTTARKVGYGLTHSSGTNNYLEVAGQGSDEGDSSFINRTYGQLQNNTRWYPSQDIENLGVGSPVYDVNARLRINYRNICGLIRVKCCEGFDDLTYIKDERDWEKVEIHDYTLDEWENEHATQYPCIIQAYMRFYVGENNSRSIEDCNIFSAHKVDCDDMCYGYDYAFAEFERTQYPKLNAEIVPYAYLPQVTLYEGFLFYHNTGSNPSTVVGLSRGLYMHSELHRACYKYTVTTMRAVALVYFTGTADDLRKAAGQLRIPFAPTEEKAMYGDIETDPDITVPRSNKDGTWKDNTKDPKKKKEALDDDPRQEGFDADNIPDDVTEPDPEDPTDEDYMPDEDPEEKKEEKDVPLNEPKLGTVGVFNRCYAVNANELQKLADYLWNVDETTFETIIKGLSLMGQNPMNAIISIIMYPFTVDETGTLEDIRIGTVDTKITGLAMDFSSVRVFDLGSCYCQAMYKNYLDYAPYTSISLYVPYVGVISLPPSEFMHKFITVKLVVDIMTGVGQVVVYAKSNEPDSSNYGLPLIYRNCVIGAQIAVTGQDASTIAGNYIKAITELSKGAVGFAGGNVASAGGIAQGSIDLLTAGNVPIESSGSNSPQCGFFMPQRCALIVHRPQPVQISNYAHLVGYACYDGGNVGKYTGYAEFTNIKLDINVATDDEKKEIIAKLKSGVYV